MVQTSEKDHPRLSRPFLIAKGTGDEELDSFLSEMPKRIRRTFASVLGISKQHLRSRHVEHRVRYIGWLSGIRNSVSFLLKEVEKR